MNVYIATLVVPEVDPNPRIKTQFAARTLPLLKEKIKEYNGLWDTARVTIGTGKDTMVAMFNRFQYEVDCDKEIRFAVHHGQVKKFRGK
ncbi:MAG: hypothetical protein A2Y38_17250 [Spirochaetes bacterium GWB1_59_5]|nr:MAG: hypothetical protein A2Y38_17250 [Spirochaetes bacterium GWB1_59_5]